MQRSLFGGGEPGFDARLPNLRRVGLAGGAWLEHHPGWLEGHAQVFEALAGSVPWQSQLRRMYDREVAVPRLVARAPEAGPMAALLRELGRTLSERYRWSLDSVSLALYRHGSDSVAFHGDKVGRFVNDSVVATVSVGAPRRFLMKPSGGGESLSFDLGWGDLFVMGGTCQRTWQHAVPKRAHSDPRISIMFRPSLSGGG